LAIFRLISGKRLLRGLPIIDFQGRIHESREVLRQTGEEGSGEERGEGRGMTVQW
jgi:hypothetical protein